MKEGVPATEGLFREQFLEKGLVTFVECSSHYAGLGADDLMREMRLLFSPPMLAIPFGVAGTRYYALMNALIACAGYNSGLDDRERTKLVNICIDVCTYLRSRTAEGRQDVFSLVLSAALDRVALSGLFPHVAALIAQGIRDYAGPYEPSAAVLVREHRQGRDPLRGSANRQVA